WRSPRGSEDQSTGRAPPTRFFCGTPQRVQASSSLGIGPFLYHSSSGLFSQLRLRIKDSVLPFAVTRPVTIQEISDEVVIPDLFDILPSLGCYLHDQSGHEKVEVYSGDMDERWHVQVLWSQSI